MILLHVPPLGKNLERLQNNKFNSTVEVEKLVLKYWGRLSENRASKPVVR